MKRKNFTSITLIALIFTTTFLSKLNAQIGQTIYVDGSHIMGPCSDTLWLKGVNYAPYNWGYSPAELNINEVAQTGANCIRLPWYYNPVGASPIATYGDLVKLDSALSKSIANDLIPIVELHDLTCQNDTSALLNMGNWFIQPAVLTLIDKYKHSIIINIANEALYVNWTGNPAQAQNRFVNTYTAIVNTIRTAGVTVPIMIDGPDCGTNLDVLSTVGPTLQLNDPVNNLIFSAHAYWYAYANNDSATMQGKINTAIQSGIPFVFGEIANLQDDVTMCQYTLNYQPLLNICAAQKIGWIAWSWDHDGCSARQMSTAGAFSSLTPYGNDLVNNTVYGMLSNPWPKSEFLVNGACGTSSINENNVEQINIYPNPNSGSFYVQTNHVIISTECFDVMGKQYIVNTISKNSFEIQNANTGVYYIKQQFSNGTYAIQKIIIE